MKFKLYIIDWDTMDVYQLRECGCKLVSKYDDTVVGRVFKQFNIISPSKLVSQSRSSINRKLVNHIRQQQTKGAFLVVRDASENDPWICDYITGQCISIGLYPSRICYARLDDKKYWEEIRTCLINKTK